jgi:WD40 repeat protein
MAGALAQEAPNSKAKDAGYDAFVSYSHEVDGRLAPALQTALQRFAKPWYRLRALRLFRDETSLAATPALWPSIEVALARSRFLIVLASPDAAESPWVGRELVWWLEHRSPETMLIAVTAGRLPWEAVGEGADAISPEFAAALLAEPRWVDLRWARKPEQLSLRDPRFRAAVADLAAPIHNVPKDRLIGDDIRQHRRTVRLARAAVTALALLTLGVGGAAAEALRQRDHARNERDRARTQARIALSRALSGQAVDEARARPDLAALLSLEALRLDANADARNAFATAVQQAARPNLLATLVVGGSASELALAPDDRTLAIGHDDGRITLFDLVRQRQLGTSLRGHSEIVSTLAFSPDGRLLASGSQDATVRLWDVARRRAAGPPLRGHGSEWIDYVGFEHGGRTLLSGSNHRLRSWDVGRRRALGEPLDFDDDLRDFALHPDGRLAMVTRQGGEGGIVDRRRGVWIDEQLPANILDSAYSPDGRLLALAREDGTITFLDAERGVRRGPVLQPRGAPWTIAFSPDSRRLVSVSGDLDGRVQVWDVARRQPIGDRLDARAPSSEQPVAFTADGRRLVSLGEDGRVRVWGLPLASAPRGHRGTVTGVAMSADGRLAASTGEDGRVRLWNTATREAIGRPLRIGGIALDVALSPDGRALAAISWDALKVWRRTGAGWSRPWVPDLEATGYSVAFSPDGRVLAAGYLGGIVLWDLARGEPLVPSLEITSGAVTSLAFSRDGRTLASTDVHGALRLWNAKTGEPRGKPLREGTPRSVAFTRDGRTLVAGLVDGRIAVWDVRARRLLGPPLVGHRDAVTGVAISADGRTLASVSIDREARVWDLERRKPLGTILRGAGGDVSLLDGVDVAFTRDGGMLLHTAATGAVSFVPDFWSERRPALRAHVCHVIGHNLTRAEWRDYLPGEPYRGTCPGLGAATGIR